LRDTRQIERLQTRTPSVNFDRAAAPQARAVQASAPQPLTAA
jgi:hypothetical protein